MTAWAQRYHLEACLLPIATTVAEPINSRLIAFYTALGIPFAAGQKHYAKESTPTPVRLLKPVAVPNLRMLKCPILISSSV